MISSKSSPRPMPVNRRSSSQKVSLQRFLSCWERCVSHSFLNAGETFFSRLFTLFQQSRHFRYDILNIQFGRGARRFGACFTLAFSFLRVHLVDIGLKQPLFLEEFLLAGLQGLLG